MPLNNTMAKDGYIRPVMVLSICFVEESICSASASIVIGNQEESYSPSIEDWGGGTQHNHYKEIDL